MAGFFIDVPERIAFGGLESTDPLTFKVYEPDRVVLGKRMEDHLRIAVCLWHSFNWPGSDVFGVGTFDRPWLLPGADPMEAARAKVDAAFEFVAKLGVPFFTFHDRDVAPEGSSFAETSRMLDVVDGRSKPTWNGRGQAPVGHSQPVQPPAIRGRGGNQSRPEVFAYAAAQVRHMLETTHRLRGANYVLWGGREGYETLLNTDLAREEVAARAVPDSRRRAQASDRLCRDAAARAEAAGADEAPVRLRLRHGGRIPHAPRSRRRVPGEHRGEPRHPGRPQLRARGRCRDQSGHLREHRHEPRRPAERLGHRPVPELGRRPGDRRATRSCAPAASRPADSTSTPSCDVRASTDRTCSTPTSAGSTRSLARCSSPPTCSRRVTWPTRRTAATQDGDPVSAQRSSTAGCRSPTSKRVSSSRASTRGRAPVDRSAWRTSSTSASGQPTGTDERWRPTSSASTSRRRRRRRSSSTSRARWRRSDRPRTATRCRGRSGASRTRSSGGTRPRRRSAPRSRAPTSLAPTSPPSGSPGRCTAPCSSTTPTSHCVRRSSGTTSEPRPSATRSANWSGTARLIEVTGNDALTGFTAPKLLWVRQQRAGDLGPRSPTSVLPKDYVRLG